MKKTFLFLPLSLLLLCGCANSEAASCVQDQLFAMDTVMDFTIYAGSDDSAQQADDAAKAEIERLDALLSRQDENSAIAAINRSGGAPVSADSETLALLKTAVGYSTMTDGAFSVTVAPIMDAWNFTGDNPRVPSRAELDALLQDVGDERISFGDGTVTLEQGMAVDLGGIAKGYASDKTAELFAESGISGGFVSLGGNVYVHGVTAEGQPWNVAIQDPQNTEGFACTLRLSDAFVVTSGGYQRFFTGPDGTVYQHIIDPATGYPVQSDLLSVSIVTRRDNGGTGTMADAYSTALYVMGEAAAVDFWRQHSAAFDMVLVTADGRLLYTPGLADCFNKTEGSGYDDQCLTA